MTAKLCILSFSSKGNS